MHKFIAFHYYYAVKKNNYKECTLVISNKHFYKLQKMEYNSLLNRC